MRFFFDRTITVERLTDEGGATKEAYASNGTIYASLLPATAEDAFLDLGDPAKTYTLITGEDSDIQETDRITDEDSIKYTVKGVRKVRLLSSSHIEATVVELNS